MIEITNRSRGPVQLIVRSKKHPRSFTTLNVPGVGVGENVVVIEDERHTDYIDRLENEMKMITTKRVSNKSSKGD